MKFNNAKLKGRIAEKYGTQEKFGEALGWGNAKVSQKLANLEMWRLSDVRNAARVLDIPSCDIGLYFFSY